MQANIPCAPAGTRRCAVPIDRYLAPHPAHRGKRLADLAGDGGADFLHRVLEPLAGLARRLAAMGAACWWGSRS